MCTVFTSSSSKDVLVYPSIINIKKGLNTEIFFSKVKDLSKIIVMDNEMNITNSLEESKNFQEYKYTLNNVLENHKITVSDTDVSYTITIENHCRYSEIVVSKNIIQVSKGSSYRIEIYSSNIEAVDIFDNTIRVNNLLFKDDNEENKILYDIYNIDEDRLIEFYDKR